MSLNDLEVWPRRILGLAAGAAIVAAGASLWRQANPGYQQGWVPHDQFDAIRGRETMAREMAARANGTDFYLSTLRSPDQISEARMADRFKTAREARIDGDAVVLGVTHAGESKAYEVGWVFSLQVINDEIGGLPIFVSG